MECWLVQLGPHAVSAIVLRLSSSMCYPCSKFACSKQSRNFQLLIPWCSHGVQS